MSRTDIPRPRPAAGWVVLLALSGLLLGAACSAGGPGESATSVLPFIEDDYGAALAQARERQLPLFIEAWAPW